MQVEKVLGELEALAKPRTEVLNKVDLLNAEEREALANRLQAEPPGARVTLSARTGEGIDALLDAVDQALHSDPLMDADLRVPQQDGSVLAAIEAGMVIHTRSYEGNLVHLAVTGPASLLGRLREYRLRTR